MPKPTEVPFSSQAPPPASALSAYSILATSSHSLAAWIGAAPAGLLVAGEQDDDVAVRLEALGAQPQQSGGDRDHALLVVGGAAPVEIAVRRAELERLARPIGAQRVDHVHMRHQQDRLAPRRPRGGPAQDQGGGLVVGPDDVILLDRDVGEAAGAELLLQIIGHGQALAAPLHGRHRDHPLVDLARLLVPLIGRLHRDRRRLGDGDGGGGEQGGGEDGEAHRRGTPERRRGLWRKAARGQSSPWPSAR